MDQNWFYRGNALIHSLSEQETTSHSVAVWRIGQCGVFLKYNGKIILIDPVLEPIYGTDGVCRTHFEPPFSADANFSVDAVHIIIWIISSRTRYANWRLLIRM